MATGIKYDKQTFIIADNIVDVWKHLSSKEVHQYRSWGISRKENAPSNFVPDNNVVFLELYNGVLHFISIEQRAAEILSRAEENSF
jgi:hypothetical protein